MRFSQATGRTVMSVTDATTVGTVSGFVVDVSVPRVVGLRLRRSGGRGTVLSWSRVQAIGPDAVMARGDDAPDGPGGPVGSVGSDREETARLEELADKRFALLDKRVLTELGEEIGTVQDADFDPESGTLLSIMVSGDAEGATWDVDARRVMGLGGYALVLQAH